MNRRTGHTQPVTAVDSVEEPSREGPEPLERRHAVFGVVGIALLMVSLDQTSVATALTAIASDLDADLSWIGWIITVYAVAQILALPLGGRLGDQFGRRRVFLIAVSVFTLLSCACALTTGVGALIACRFLQGLAGGVILPAANGIVAHHFGRERDRALALFTSVFPIGAILGPVVGGIVLTVWSWHGIFLINAPIGLVLVVAGSVLIVDPPRGVPGRLDVVGIVLLPVTLLSMMAAVTLFGSVLDGGAARWIILILTGVIAAVAAVLFSRHLRRRRDAVVPVRLLVGRGLGIVNLTNVVFGAAVIGFSALLPLYAQIRYAVAPLVAGILLTGRAVGTIAFCWVAVLLLRRCGYRPLLMIGLMAVVGGLVVAALPPAGMNAAWWLIVASALTGVGVGTASPAAANAGMRLVGDDVAAAAGLRTMFRQVGGIVAVSATTTAMTASSDAPAAAAVSFLVLAGLLVAVTAMATRVPNRRGRW